MNPWIKVPYEDYERHMKDESVYQLQKLNEIFKIHLEKFKPESVLVLGCSGGNGFEHIDDDITKKVIGIDINDNYLKICKNRYKNKKYVLDLICCDINIEEFQIDIVDFISCALFLEYVDIRKVLIKIKNRMKYNSKLNIVVQNNNSNSFVSKTGVESLNILSNISKEISEKGLQDILESLHFSIESKDVYDLPNGKEFISFICQRN